MLSVAAPRLCLHGHDRAGDRYSWCIRIWRQTVHAIAGPPVPPYPLVHFGVSSKVLIFLWFFMVFRWMMEDRRWWWMMVMDDGDGWHREKHCFFNRFGCFFDGWWMMAMDDGDGWWRWMMDDGDGWWWRSNRKHRWICMQTRRITCSDYNFTAACGYTGTYVGRQHHVKWWRCVTLRRPGFVVCDCVFRPRPTWPPHARGALVHI